MSYFPEPPYFLLVIGLLVALTCGTAFSATLKQIVQKWSSARVGNTIAQLRIGGVLLVPFLGICVGVCIFLGSGLEVFGLSTWLSYALAVPLTLLLGLLIWLQLGSMLSLVERKGFQAIDIDSWPSK